MKKIAGILTLSASLLAAGAGIAVSGGPYESVGTLDCAFKQGGAVDAVLCDFVPNSGGALEQYFALVNAKSIARTSNVKWDVLKLTSTGAYQNGGLAGDYVISKRSGGMLVAASDTGMLLEAQSGPKLQSGISFVNLRQVN